MSRDVSGPIEMVFLKASQNINVIQELFIVGLLVLHYLCELKSVTGFTGIDEA